MTLYSLTFLTTRWGTVDHISLPGEWAGWGIRGAAFLFCVLTLWRNQTFKLPIRIVLCGATGVVVLALEAREILILAVVGGGVVVGGFLARLVPMRALSWTTVGIASSLGLLACAMSIGAQDWSGALVSLVLIAGSGWSLRADLAAISRLPDPGVQLLTPVPFNPRS